MTSFSFFPILGFCKNFDVQLIYLRITIKNNKGSQNLFYNAPNSPTPLCSEKMPRNCIEWLEYPYLLEIHLDSAGLGSLSTCK